MKRSQLKDYCPQFQGECFRYEAETLAIEARREFNAGNYGQAREHLAELKKLIKEFEQVLPT